MAKYEMAPLWFTVHLMIIPAGSFKIASMLYRVSDWQDFLMQHSFLWAWAAIAYTSFSMHPLQMSKRCHFLNLVYYTFFSRTFFPYLPICNTWFYQTYASAFSLLPSFLCQLLASLICTAKWSTATNPGWIALRHGTGRETKLFLPNI